MIYCKLKGGLGNIMFQIAGAMSLAIDRGVECSFTNLDYQLRVIEAEFDKNGTGDKTFEYLEFLKDLKTETPNGRVREINYQFHYQEEHIGDEDVLIHGFFQSEKYFLKHREEILRAFSKTERIDNIINTKYSDILSKRTTAIHVRRGDYLTLPNHHPSPTLEYFRKAMDILKDDTDLYVVFSDDVQWCVDNLEADNVYVVKDEKDYIELFLMSMCDNNIISNSTFSWWGAWMNENENKKIIAPEIWWGDMIKMSPRDIIPENWIKI